MSSICWTKKEIEFIKKDTKKEKKIIKNKIIKDNNISSEEIEFIKKKPSKI